MGNIQTIIEEIKPGLEILAEKMGQGGMYAFELAVRQQYVDGVIGLFWGIIGLVTLIVYAISFKGFYGWVQRGDGDGGREVIMILTTIFTVIFGLLAFTFGMTTAITHFLNPEWQAIKDIVKLVNPM